MKTASLHRPARVLRVCCEASASDVERPARPRRSRVSTQCIWQNARHALLAANWSPLQLFLSVLLVKSARAGYVNRLPRPHWSEAEFDALLPLHRV